MLIFRIQKSQTNGEKFPSSRKTISFLDFSNVYRIVFRFIFIRPMIRKRFNQFANLPGEERIEGLKNCGKSCFVC
jgi:hypothetical protein